MEDFEKKMAVFSFGQHQDVMTYLDLLNKNGWTVDEAREWVESEKKRHMIANKEMQKKFESLRKCPECENPMISEPINVSPKTMTGDDSTIVHTCIYIDCMHQIFE